MSGYRTRFIVFVLCALLTFISIPGLYLWRTTQNLDAAKVRDLIFNVNTAESYSNYLLYRLGISANPQKAIVGKDGWLYLGDHYADIVTYSRQSQFDMDRIEKSAEWFRERYVDLQQRKIIGLHVLPPNKLSVYPEMAPEWLQLPDHGITDSFMELMTKQGPGYLDLRTDLLDEKKDATVYYKTDSHWNRLGGLIAYRRLMEEFRNASSLALTSVDVSSIRPIPKTAGGNARLLKIDSLLGDEEDEDVRISLAQEREDICVSKLNPVTLEPEGHCNSRSNSMLHVTKPLLVTNENALNDVRVVWYRDSFGTAMSPLMHKTFKKIWEIPYYFYYYCNAVKFIESQQTDFVVFMSVERNLIHRVMSDLPGETPASIAGQCLPD